MGNLMKVSLCILIILITVPLYSMNYILGVKAGYFEWQPFLKEVGAGGFDEAENGVGILYGPVASILFTSNISLSATLLHGKQSAHWDSYYKKYSFETEKLVTGTYNFDTERTDLDSALSYRVHDNIKLFIGYKVQYLKGELMYTELRTTDTTTRDLNEINISRGKNKIFSHGPAAGFGLSIPFGEGLFSTANISGVYMHGYFEFYDSYRYNYSNFTTHLYQEYGNSDKFDTIQYGINFEPSLGYQASGPGLIFTLGFRYQWLRTNIKGEFPGDDKVNDYFYGAYMSVLYTI